MGGVKTVKNRINMLKPIVIKFDYFQEKDNQNVVYLPRKKSLIVKKIPISKNGTNLAYFKNNSYTNTKVYPINSLSSNTTLNSVISEETVELLQNLPGMISWKSIDSVFLGCNQKLAVLGNLANPEDIVGKQDCDLPWGDYSTIFREEDKEVLAGNILYVLGKYPFSDKERLVLTKKLPIIDGAENIVGIFNYMIEIPQTSVHDIVFAFNEFEIEMSPALVEIIKSIFFETHIKLSLREEQCAYYLLQGLSSKEIGKHLELSYRTVEIHLTCLKEKLQCKKISALIVKLIRLGYLENVPDRLPMESISV